MRVFVTLNERFIWIDTMISQCLRQLIVDWLLHSDLNWIVDLQFCTTILIESLICRSRLKVGARSAGGLHLAPFTVLPHRFTFLRDVGVSQEVELRVIEFIDATVTVGIAHVFRSTQSCWQWRLRPVVWSEESSVPHIFSRVSNWSVQLWNLCL